MSQYQITRTRKIHPVPAVWNGISHTSEQVKNNHGIALESDWTICLKGDFTAVHQSDDWNRVATFLCDRMVEDPIYLATQYDKQRVAGQSLVKLSRKLIAQSFNDLSISELINHYKEIQSGWLEFDQLNVFPWLIGGPHYQSHLSEALLSSGATIPDEDFETLITNPKLSFSAEEELKLLNLALKLQTNGSSPQDHLAEIDELVDLYYWIPFGYDGPVVYDRNHYINTLQTLLEKDSNDLYSKQQQLDGYENTMIRKQDLLYEQLNLSDNLKHLIKQMHILSMLTDERKEYTFQAHVAFDKVLVAISRSLGTDKMVLKYILLDELVAYSENIDKLKEIAQKRTEGLAVFAASDGVLQVIEGDRAQQLLEQMIPKTDDAKVLKGQIGCRGADTITRGRVKILLSPIEMSKLESGEILVSTMTTPEYVPAMRRSIAIVTDEGGVTCHAAIVSRELNLPCIIGTKAATRVLKDGDIIEMNTSEGTIRVLE
jgi:phosphohistidine swiveling domain-containing protein